MREALFGWFILWSLAVPWLFLMWRYDRFVRAAYQTDREFWRKMGEPRGYFWIPREKLFSFFAFGGMNSIPRNDSAAKAFFEGREQMWPLYAEVLRAKRRAFIASAIGLVVIFATMLWAHFFGLDGPWAK